MRNPYLAFLALFLHLNVLSACGEDGPAVTVGDVVFDDPELQRCYDDETFQYADDWDVSVVEQLFCGDLSYTIRRLDGIETLHGLIGLVFIRQTSIEDYSPLAKLPSLVDLNVRGNNISQEDLAVISQMMNLQYLTLDEVVVGLGDVSLLGNLINLVSLSLYDAGVTTGVKELTSLQSIFDIDLEFNPGLPCEDVEQLKASLPDAIIRPVVPEPGVSCAE